MFDSEPRIWGVTADGGMLGVIGDDGYFSYPAYDAYEMAASTPETLAELRALA